MKTLVTLVVVINLWTIVNCYSVLGIFPHPGKSHFDVFEPLLKALAKKGHNVTTMSHFPQKKSLPNYKDVNLQNSAPILVNVIEMETIAYSRFDRYLEILFLMNWGVSACHDGLSSPAVKEFLQTKHKFDVIITEFFDNECFLGFVHKFKAPLIGASTSVMMSWDNEKFGNPSHPAYIPNNILPYSDHMSFMERVENTVVGVVHDVIHGYFMDVINNKIAKNFFGENLPSLRDIAYNTSLVLVNSHFSLSRPRPLVPGFIEIGGLHIGQVKNLPQNIEKWINESTHGVIYFSLGSMIKGHTFPEEKRQMFLRAFGRLPQRVLWKWETEMPGKPDNVMIQKWMPQFDILSHPNVKAFIAHGGLLGTTEAVHCGVPMIIMPQFGDQFTNAKAVEASGGGVILDFRSLDEESIYNALTTVLDPSFNKKAKELSARFRDRPLPPLDTAIYWVEYVARHGGAPHMRTAAVGMPFYQYLLLDVVAFLAAVLFIIIYINYRLIKFVFRRIFKGSPAKKVKKN